jgi:hypothetical protein
MANAYFLLCTRDYETVVPASPIVLTGCDGVRTVTDDVLPERRWWHTAGQRYTARRKAEAESMVRSGNWAWEQ